MDPTPFPPSGDEAFADSLRELCPAPTPLDPSIVFYRMGLQAGMQRAESQTRSRRYGLAVAALLLAAIVPAAVAGPVGYRLGQATVIDSAANRALAQTHDEPAGDISAAPPSAPSRRLTDTAPPTAPPPETTPPEAIPAAVPTVDGEAAESETEPTPRPRPTLGGWLAMWNFPYPLIGSADTSQLVHRVVSQRERLLDEHLNPPRRTQTPRPDNTPHSQPVTANPRSPHIIEPPLRATDWKEIIQAGDFY